MKRKGFTLIELLAVILVLGIIALIAVPTVSKIIVQAKKGAFEATVTNIVKAVEDECQKKLLLGDPQVYVYTFSDTGISPNINIKGKTPSYGRVRVDSKCNASIKLSDGKYTVRKSYLDDSLSTTDGNEALVDVWDGTTVSSSLEGSGNPINPYLINSAADLAYVRNKVNAGETITGDESMSAVTANYKLMIDIELNDPSDYINWNEDSEGLNNWIPIGNETNPYKNAVFDGNNHTIAGMYINSTNTPNGFFGEIANTQGQGPTISNLTITQSFIYGSNNTGSIVGIINTNNGGSTYITNCKSDAIIKGDGYNIGGMIGKNFTNSSGVPSYYEDLEFSGVIETTNENVGGIVGYQYASASFGSANTSVSNKANIKGSSTVGGIAGYLSIQMGPIWMNNNYNSGNITATSTSGSSNVGGIFGSIYNVASSFLTSLSNTGDVTGYGEYVGGIGGKVGSSPIASFSSIYNTGNVSGSAYVAGLIGACESCNVSTIGNTTSTIYNTGIITGKYYVAGIFGYFNPTIATTISNVYNKGTVNLKNVNSYTNGAGYVGGLFGYMSSSNLIKLNNSYNNSTINESIDYHTNGTGGLIGSTQSAKVEVKNCYNNGKINTSNTHSGGIIGEASYDTTITNTYNAADMMVNNAANDGVSIAGISRGNIGSIRNVYNVGNISANSNYTANYVAGITVESTIETLENAYNSGNITFAGTGTMNAIAGLSTSIPTTSTSNAFLSTTAVNGIYTINEEVSTTGVTAISNLDSMPTVISVINGDSKFKADTNNINGGYPILNWQ